MDGLRSIIQPTMELWRIYKFLRYAKDNPGLEYVELRSSYREKYGLVGNEDGDLWDAAIDRGLIEATGMRFHIRTRGKDMLEGRIGPVSIGLVIAELKQYNPLIIFLTGAIITTLIHWLIDVIKLIINHI